MADETTPMMKQYFAIRRQTPADTILFFRLGDFYEMFFDDAKEASRILDIALTRRNNVPMCGIPYHSAEGYLARIIRAGRKVAICEQVEDPAEAKGIVRREVTRVVTPGTVFEDQVLDANRNNYLAGLCPRGKKIGLAWLDLSTGAFWIEEEESPAAIADAIARNVPSECVLPESERDGELAAALRLAGRATVVTTHEDWTFDRDVATEHLCRHFGLHSLDGLGCAGMEAAVGAAGGMLHYVTGQLKLRAEHIRPLRVKRSADHMVLDETSLRNLDLVPQRGGDGPSLMGTLDATRSSMGSRLLREWLLRPLMQLDAIHRRHDAVEALMADRGLLHDLREQLGEIKDLERLIARLNAGGGNARDLRAVGQSLAGLPPLKERASGAPAELLQSLATAIDPLPDLRGLIDRAIEEEPPISLRDGGLIRKGYHEELDQLRAAATDGRTWIAEFQAREQERTGIKTLKVRHNKVFGYYIEITQANLGGVPEDYVRKQTLVNAERFITPELKEVENRILGAQDRSIDLEFELFREVREQVVAQTGAIQATAEAVAQLDVLCAFADRALALRYVRPAMSEGSELWLRDSRHPVIEEMVDSEPFVPNDAHLDTTDNQLIIITGPNMAGKSTYIRQVAILAIMAQAGCFVPAAEARLGLIDRVFTRVGAGDDLARGRSTFMVEMQETANILNSATPRSLVVLDEIGRGTSTFDGISIAWAVAEFLHNDERVKAKTLFATHYHELTDLALTMPGVKNYNVLVREKNDRIAFLRKIVPGAADKSYGIQVAQLAGLPPEVISRAREILTNLEEGEFGEGGQPKIARHRPRKTRPVADQLSFL